MRMQNSYLLALNRFRRKAAAARLPAVLMNAFGMMIAAAALLSVAVRCGWFGRNVYWCLPLVLAAAGVFFFCRSRLSSVQSARLADRLSNADRRAENAWELLKRNAEGEFAEYAIQCGVESLDLATTRLTGEKIRWRNLVIPVLILLLVQLPVPSFLHTRETISGTGAVPSDSRADSRKDSELNSPEKQNPTAKSAGSENNSGRGSAELAGRTGKSGTDGDLQNVRSGSRSAIQRGRGGSGVPANPESESVPDEDTDSRQSAESSGRNTAGGAAGNGGLSGEENGTNLMNVAAGSTGDGRSRNERKRQKKSVRKKIQESRGGVQPLLPDCNPPAGRELSEKEGHGDQPGDGRGGDTGAKKSRGAAAFLPVTPQPDTVAGRLGVGEDLTSAESGRSEGDGQLSGTPADVRRAAEPLSRFTALPETVRRQIRNNMK